MIEVARDARGPAIPSDSVTEQEIDKMVTAKIANVSQHMRRTIEEAWELGLWLNIKRKRTDHAHWGPWLEGYGLNMNTAWRYMKLTEHSWADLGQYSTIAKALSNLKPDDHAKPQRSAGMAPNSTISVNGEVVNQPEAHMTKSERRLLEDQRLKSQLREAEERAAEAEQQRDEANQVSAHLQQGEKVSEGFHQGSSVIEQLQARTRQLLAEVSRRDDEVTTLKRENTALRQRIKQMGQEIENLTRDEPVTGSPRESEPTNPAYGTPKPSDEDLPEYDVDDFNDEAYQ